MRCTNPNVTWPRPALPWRLPGPVSSFVVANHRGGAAGVHSSSLWLVDGCVPHPETSFPLHVWRRPPPRGLCFLLVVKQRKKSQIINTLPLPKAWISFFKSCFLETACDSFFHPLWIHSPLLSSDRSWDGDSVCFQFKGRSLTVNKNKKIKKLLTFCQQPKSGRIASMKY